MDKSAASALERIRNICLALPEATEKPSHGSPCFFIRDKNCFVMFVDNHHDDGRLAIWCAAPPGIQSELVSEAPERFFVPPYVGHRGWVGARLERSRNVDWRQLAELIEEGFRMVAPRKVLAQLDGNSRTGPKKR